MFDMSWSELLLIAVVGLIVIGPKDLPKVVKTIVQFAQKARSLAREFQSGVEEMAREAELHEVKTALEKDMSEDFVGDLEHSIDPGGHIEKSLDLQAEDARPISEPALPPVGVGHVESEPRPQDSTMPADSKDPIFLDAKPAEEPSGVQALATVSAAPEPTAASASATAAPQKS